MSADFEELTPDEYHARIEESLTEFELQRNFFGGIRGGAQAIPLLNLVYAIPNEGQRSRAAAGKRIAEGMRHGVPDVHCPFPSGRFSSLFIEFKKYGEDLRPDQKIICKMLALAGNGVVVSQSARAALELVMAWINGNADRFGLWNEDPVLIYLDSLNSWTLPIPESFGELGRQLREFELEKEMKRIRRRGRR